MNEDVDIEERDISDISFDPETTLSNYSRDYMKMMIELENRGSDVFNHPVVQKSIVPQWRKIAINAGMQGLTASERLQFTRVPRSHVRVENFRSSLMSRLLSKEKTGVVVITGPGRSGKTAFAWWAFLEGCFRERRVALFDYPSNLRDVANKNTSSLLSDKYYIVKTLDDVEKGDVIFVDDAIRLLMARSSNTKFAKKFTSYLTAISHKDEMLVMTLQSLALLDVSVLRSQNVFFFAKCSENMEQNIKLEREGFKEIISNVLDGLRSIWETQNYKPYEIGYAYNYGQDLFFKNSILPWYDDRFSKPFQDINIRDFDAQRLKNLME